tara:strand:+ start:11226 stop:13160 length:1935 start_codon:yes stop_codon:yes gene_type:complete
MNFQQLLEQIRNIKQNQQITGTGLGKTIGRVGQFLFSLRGADSEGKFPGLTTKESKELEALRKSILDTYAQSLMTQEIDGTRYLTVEELMKQGFTESEAERRSKEPISGSYRLNPDMTMKEAMAQAERDFERAINVVEAEPIDPSMLEGVGMQQAPGMPQPIIEGGVYKGDQIDLLKEFEQSEDLSEAERANFIDNLLKGTDVDLQTLQTLLAKEKAKGTKEGDEKAKKLQDQINKQQSKKPVPSPANVYAPDPSAEGQNYAQEGIFSLGGALNLDPTARRTQFAQVDLSDYATALPTMLPGGSIAPMEATYQGIVPQLYNAFKMAQRLGDIPGDPNALEDATDTYLFQNWLMTDPDIRGTLKRGLDAIEKLRSRINSLPENQRQGEIDKLNVYEKSLWSQYLAPKYDAAGNITNAFAGAENELALRQSLNTYLPEALRSSANQALQRQYRRGMAMNPLDQYNLFQGSTRPSALMNPVDTSMPINPNTPSPIVGENISDAELAQNMELMTLADTLPENFLGTNVVGKAGNAQAKEAAKDAAQQVKDTTMMMPPPTETPPAGNILNEISMSATPSPITTSPVKPPIPGGPTIMGTQQPNDFTKYGIQPQGFASQSYWNAFANQNPPPAGFVYSNTGNLIPIGGVI